MRGDPIPPTMGPVMARASAARPPAVAILLALACACVVSCRQSPRASGAGSGRDAAYAGPASCAECHASIAKSYAGTGMGRSFYPLEPDSAVEDFTSDNRLELPDSGLAYEMTARDDGYWMRQAALGAGGEILAEAELRMAYVLGSGNHSRSYLAERDGYLFEMPVCWYPGKPGWDLCPGYEHNNRFFGRAADVSCLYCHNARVPLLPGATNRYGDGMPHGIDCERCHGPGERHVALWRDPPEKIPSRDDTIVNPAKLPRETRIHVCLQCHLGDADGSERVNRAGVDLLEFRPGDLLTDFVDVMTFETPAVNRFGLGGQGDRFLLSRCYRESGGALDCLTCHDPHVTVYAGSTPRDRYRKACLGCHAAGDCGLAEKERRLQSPEDDCAACHMRKAEPADQRFTVFTDHWIRKRIDPPGPPGPPRTDYAVRPHFPELRGGLGPGEDAYDRGRALLVMKSGNEAGPRIPWRDVESHLSRAIAENPELAEAWLLLGRAALSQGRRTEAIGHFRQALGLDPSLRGARLNLASTLLEMGRGEEAEPLLREAIRLKEDDEEALSDLGRTLVLLGREAEAEEILKRATSIHGVHATPLANLGLLHARQGRHREAEEELRRAAALEPSVAEIWSALAASLRALGRDGEAAACSARAARLAGAGQGAGGRLRGEIAAR